MSQSREASDARPANEQTHASVADEIRRRWEELTAEGKEQWRGAAAAGEQGRDADAVREDDSPPLLVNNTPTECTAEDLAAVQRMYDDLSAYIHSPDDREGEQAAFACTDEALAALSEENLWPNEEAKEDNPRRGKT